jgi:hypothetical protein
MVIGNEALSPLSRLVTTLCPPKAIAPRRRLNAAVFPDILIITKTFYAVYEKPCRVHADRDADGVPACPTFLVHFTIV